MNVAELKDTRRMDNHDPISDTPLHYGPEV